MVVGIANLKTTLIWLLVLTGTVTFVYVSAHRHSGSYKAKVTKLYQLIDSGRCDHFYFDMGTNIGVQIRKLYEPQYFEGAPVLPIFDKYFGEDRRRVCAVGFEPNIVHVQRLNEMERAYTNAGFPLVIFTTSGLSHMSGILTFYHDIDRVDNGTEFSNSMYDVRALRDAYNVTAIDAGSFYANISKVWSRPPHAKVVAKLDIEGAEYVVMPSIMGHGALCFFDLLFIEYHPHYMVNTKELTFRREMIDMLPKMLNYVKVHTSSCNTEFTDLDDESFGGGVNHPFPPPV